MDPLKKGHNRNNLSIKDASLGPKCSLSHSTITLQTLKRGQPPYKEQKWLVPNASFIQRFHCIL